MINNEMKIKEYYGNAGFVKNDTGNDSVDMMIQKKDSTDDGVSFKKSEKSGSYANCVNEFLKERQEKVKEETKEDEKLEDEAKEEARMVVRSLSEEEMEKLRQMGIDISNTSMTDISGIITTMRANEHKQMTREIMAKAHMENGDADDITVMGGQVMFDGVEIDIDVKDVVVEEIKSERIAKDDILYLIKNNMPVNKDTLYKAHFSGTRVDKNQTTEDLSDMKPQIEKIVMQAGEEPTEDNINIGYELLKNDIPVTTDNIRKMINYSKIVDMGIDDVELFTQEEIEQIASRLYEKVTRISPDTVYDMERKGINVSIASAYRYEQTEAVETYANQSDEKALIAKRQMEEIRLSMTLLAATKLVLKDINIDTRELSKVVNELKNIEKKFIEGQLASNDIEVNDENVELYTQLAEKIDDIRKAPAHIIGSAISKSVFSVNSLYEASVSARASFDAFDGNDKEQSAIKFDALVKSYEAVQTAPRADMGDSIKKAFSNIEDILNEMNYPVTEDSIRAVKILGYNSLAINEENIENIITYDKQINELCDTFYPEAVLSMIKEGINPMDVPISKLNDKIREKKYNKGVSEAENFATYLRDMENMGEVSIEERESYIGLFRLMDKLAKSGNKEAGFLFANNKNLTVRNLISAMRTMKSGEIDFSVDDSTGFSYDVITKGKRIDEQIMSAFSEKTETVSEFMRINSIEEKAINIQASSMIVENPSGIFSLVQDIFSKFKYSQNVKDNLVDEETENMSDSLSGEHIALDFSLDGVLDKLYLADEVASVYENMNETINNMMYDMGTVGTISSRDIQAIKTVSAGFNIMGNMAKHGNYQLPIETEYGIRVMNLTVNNDNSKASTISISIKEILGGDIYGTLSMKNDNEIVGNLVSTVAEGNEYLQSESDKTLELIAAYGFNVEGLHLGREIKAEDVASGSTSTTTLYKAAVAIVKSVGNILSNQDRQY